MDRLPQEVLQLIVEDLPRDDLISVRIVNKALASAAAPTLFRSIPLWLGISGLEGINGISEHSTLSQYVKEIVCSPVRFTIHRGISISSYFET